MSFKLMAKAMDIKVGNATRKLVLIKLADQANDNGICYPSISTIKKTCEIKSKRTVQAHINALEAQGLIRVEKRWNTEKQCNYSNIYHVTLDGKSAKNDESEKNLPSAKIAPPSAMVAVGGSAIVAGGSAIVAPEPITEPINIEPITEPKKNKQKKENPKTFKPEKPESVNDQTWNDLLAHRKSKKCSNTQTAWNVIFSQLGKAAEATGHSQETIISEWIANDWKGFKAQWYINSQQQNTQRTGNRHANNQSANRKPNSANHFDDLRQQARAKYGNSQRTSDMRTVI